MNLERLVRDIRAWGLERVFKVFYGSYRGIVVDNDDPKGLGRCKIFVPDFGHVDEADAEAGPWATMVSPGLSRSADGSVKGNFFVPAVGDTVIVQCLKGDTDFPIYIGGWLPGDSVPDEFGANVSRGRSGIKTPAGHLLRFTEDGDITCSAGDGSGSQDGTFWTLGTDGSIHIRSSNGSYIYVEPDGTMNFVGGGGTSLKLKDGLAQLIAKDSSLVMKDGAVSLLGKTVVIRAGQTVMIDGGQVVLGSPALARSAVRGEDMVSLYQTHTHGVAGAATVPGSVAPPMLPQAQLSVKVKIE